MAQTKYVTRQEMEQAISEAILQLRQQLTQAAVDERLNGKPTRGNKQ